jgi:hypothetical protein
MIHNVRIQSDNRGYTITGAVSIRVASNPVRAGAMALLEAGHDPSDLIKAVADGVSLSPVALHRAAKPYTAPRGWDRGRDRMAA